MEIWIHQLDYLLEIRIVYLFGDDPLVRTCWADPARPSVLKDLRERRGVEEVPGGITHQHLSSESSWSPIVRLLEQYGQNSMVFIRSNVPK